MNEVMTHEEELNEAYNEAVAKLIKNEFNIRDIKIDTLNMRMMHSEYKELRVYKKDSDITIIPMLP